MNNPDFKIRVENELKPGNYAAKNVDEAVERVLEFDRNWAGFELPRLLMALSRIQAYILERRIKSVGDYSYFAAKLETLFKDPITIVLEEFGLPLQIAVKLRNTIAIGEDIDNALKVIKSLNVQKLPLDSFEKEVLREIQEHI